MQEILNALNTSNKPQLDLTSRSFDAKKFLKEVVGGVSHKKFEDGIVDDIGKAVEQTGEALKQLIRDHLGVFINSKDAMMAIYARDKKLFTGEALDNISAAFEVAFENCSNLVKPITESFFGAQHTRKTQQILEKLLSVLRIPGLLYECCGVHVARRKSCSDPLDLEDTDAEEEREPKSPSWRPTSQESKVGDDINSVSESVTSDTQKANTLTGARGEFEEFVGQAGTDTVAEAYDLPDSDHEILYWYGTALVRLRDPSEQRRCVEAASNYSGALLNLRRAMFYLEENYNLVDGTLLAREETEAEARQELLSNSHTPGAQDGSDADQTSPKHASAVVGTAFTYQFSLSLLRATLYLENQLAEELRCANAMDVVLIEDTLSMMMEVAIASVKLHHFCSTMQNSLLSESIEGLPGVREKATASLAVLAAADDSHRSREIGLETPLSRDTSRYSDFDVDDGSEVASSLPQLSQKATLNEALESTKSGMLHPAQYYISIIREQNRRLTQTDVAALLTEATNWLGKLNAPPRAVVGGHQQPLSQSHSHGQIATHAGQPKAGGDSANSANSMHLNFCPEDRNVFSEEDLDTDGRDAVSAVSKGGTGGDIKQIRDSDAEAILTAFRTPEANFETYTSFRFADLDLGNILEGSCAQITLYSKAMLEQLDGCVDSEASVMSQGASLNSFSARLCEVCITNVEQVMSSYWTGIASSIGAGIFDFYPDVGTPLHHMLEALVGSTRGGATAPLPAPGTCADFFLPRASTTSSLSAAVNSEIKATADVGPQSALAGIKPHSTCYTPSMYEALPAIRYVPVLPELWRARDQVAGRNASELASAARQEGVTLRDLSAQALHQMIHCAQNTLHSLFLSFVNCSVVKAFVHTMSQYTLSDLLEHSHDERIELHAAVLVEVIIGQWECMMAIIDESVRRMKVVLGGSYHTNVLYVVHQENDVNGLLAAVEELRSDCFSCYLHGIGVLSKAYLSMLPMLTSRGNKDGLLEYRLRARLSRDFVSSVYPNKFLNLLSVVMDRILTFVDGHVKVNSNLGVFSAKLLSAETPRANFGDTKGEIEERHCLLQDERESVSNATTRTATSKKTTAQGGIGAHAKLVMTHIEAQEDMLQALVANLLLCFVDMLHNRCRAASIDLHVELEEREANIMECVADALCTATTVSEVVLEHMLTPCFFALMAELHADNSSQVALLTKQRQEVFRQKYLSRVSEHCQLAVDAMLHIYIAIPQQHITREVRLRGFMAPLFDWQRISPQTGGTVRPYIAESIMHVAKARETLDCIHQPALESAVVQRLIAHLATSFVTAVSADINAFELSQECSPDFCEHALLLIEAEALTILKVIEAVTGNVEASKLTKGGIQPELPCARNCLQGLVRSLGELTATHSGSIKAKERSTPDTPPLGTRDRSARRDEMVGTAMRHLKYMVDAINSHLMETSTLGGPPSHPVSSEVTRSIADRLARRREGYEVRRIAQAKPQPYQARVARNKTSHGEGRGTGRSDGKEEPKILSTPPLAQDNEVGKIFPIELYRIGVEQNEKKAKKIPHQDKKATRVTMEGVQTQTPSSIVHAYLKNNVSTNAEGTEATLEAPQRHECLVHKFKRSSVL